MKQAAAEGPSLYGYEWQKQRKAYLRAHPLCAHCRALGKTTRATVVDHIIAHKGDETLFWDQANWQALCKPCHDSWKQRLEKGGMDTACNEAGLPMDPRHPWNAPRGGG